MTLKLSTSELTPKDSQSLIVRDKQKADKKKYKSLLKQTGEFVQQMVGKTTFFEKVPARDYYCYLFGTIEDTGVSKRTVGNYFMFQQFKLVKGDTKEIIFQLEREDAYVIVHALKNDEPIDGDEIMIVEKNDPKFTRASQGAFFYLKRGRYNVRAKFQGKEYFQQLDIHDLADKQLLFNLSDVSSLSEKSQTEDEIYDKAKELKNSGRVEDAVSFLKATGKADEASDLSAEEALSSGDYEKAAAIYTKAKKFLQASEVWKNAGNSQKHNEMMGAYYMQQKEFDLAIPYLEKAEQFLTISKIYQKKGEVKLAQENIAKHHLNKGEKLDAAQAYMRSEDYAKAAELYEDMNAQVGPMDMSATG